VFLLVIPVKAGIHVFQPSAQAVRSLKTQGMDPRLRGDDELVFFALLDSLGVLSETWTQSQVRARLTSAVIKLAYIRY
jgi:hypothetical protein